MTTAGPAGPHPHPGRLARVQVSELLAEPGAGRCPAGVPTRRPANDAPAIATTVASAAAGRLSAFEVSAAVYLSVRRCRLDATGNTQRQLTQ